MTGGPFTTNVQPHAGMTMSSPSGEVSESAEGARLLSEYTGLNLYRGFKSLPLRHQGSKAGRLQHVAYRLFSCLKNGSPAKMYTIVYTVVLKWPFPGGHVSRLPSLACGGLFKRGKRFGWWYGVRSRQKRFLAPRPRLYK